MTIKNIVVRRFLHNIRKINEHPAGPRLATEDQVKASSKLVEQCLELLSSQIKDSNHSMQQLIDEKLEGVSSEFSSQIQNLNRLIDEFSSLNLIPDDIYATSIHQGKAILSMKYPLGINLAIEATSAVAKNSLDHLHPWGTKRDNSKNLMFNNSLFELIPINQLRVLDIGCSGGGFVKTLIDAGVLAVGVEGSDYSKIRHRAEWSTIPEFLFTADAVHPFRIFLEGQLLKFNLITAWEVLEHIEESDLEGFFRNVASNLDQDGLFICSISPNDDWIEGVNLHRTVKSPEWWLQKVTEFGFVNNYHLVKHFAPDKWIRGEENAPNSFHFVLSKTR